MSRFCLLWAGLSAIGCGSGPEGRTGTLYAIAVSEGRWVAVGSGQTVVESRDGVHWAAAPIHTSEGALWDVAALDDLFVAVGPGMVGNGQTVTGSPDGGWQVELSGQNLGRVVAGNGVFLRTAGVEGGVASSTDGMSWSILPGLGEWLGFDGTQFVSFSSHDPDQSFMTSTDGVTRTVVAVPAAESFRDVTSLSVLGSQRLGFAVGRCDDEATGAGCKMLQLLGATGADLSQQSITPLPWPVTNATIASDGATVVVTAVGAVHVTSLPVGSAPWQDVAMEDPSYVLSDIAYQDGLFVAVGTTASNQMLMTSSPDGRTWRRVSLP